MLSVTRQAMNTLGSGKAGVSAEMVFRLEEAFGGSAEIWVRMQAVNDWAQGERHADKSRSSAAERPCIMKCVIARRDSNGTMNTRRRKHRALFVRNIYPNTVIQL